MKSGFAEEAMRALIADSDRQTLDSVNIALSICLPDCQMETTASGEDCLEAVKDRFPDIVTLDKDLPDGDGYDVLRQIKAHFQVPVIFLSGNNDEPEVVKVLELGADGYMTKPFRQFELMARIRTLLKGKQCNNQHVYYQPKEI